MEKQYPVYTLKNECNDCYKCIRGCHIKAIKIQSGSASVINDKCIACGHCVTICPAGAKKVRSDIDVVKALFLTGKKVYVSLAPSWAGVYDIKFEKMIAVLKKLGFAGVSETALGAQEVSIQTAKILNSAEKGLFISSACPVIDDYVRLYKPDFAKNITPVASPALTHAGLLKDMLGDDIKVVFIGPCIAKKNEADKHPELISASLTFDELNYWIKEEFIDIENIETDESCHFVPENSYEGALYPIEGGMNETIKQVGIDKNDVTFIAVSSLEDFDKSLQNINPDKIENKIFVEALGCSGGCINGPCLSGEKSRILVTSDIYANTQYRNDIPKEPRKVVEIEYKPNPVKKVEYPIEQVVKALKKISKHSQEDELNCSGCGYASCREFVNALIAGDAEPSQCVSYMRKIAVRKAAAMLRCMPSAVVIVDSNMEIVEANDSFERMFLSEEMYEVFSSRKDGMTGASIDRIVPFSELFKSALDSGKDIHQEHYAIKDKVYDISIFTIEDNELVGAVISDVTKSEMDRSKIAQKAREVIAKNITTVQEIASLLGEHMVDTELLLSSIAEGYDPNSGDNKNVH
ncbi:MAG: 4Fe-4S binding protein [Candidatus Gastranaerophilales bacterium]|nr:4Fe-4S binding protein [Candidatus Gastranaerophilales bacterium]